MSRLPVVAVACALAVSCTRQDAFQKPLTPVRAQVVAAGSGNPPLRYSATIEPRTRMELAFKVGGYVREIATVDGRPIDSGDRVTKGMVLARVQSSDYDDRVEQAQAQLAEAQSAEAAAKSSFDRASALFQSKSLARPDFEQARATYESMQAKVRGAQALVQQAQSARAESALESPIDGIVLKRAIEVGSLVGPGTAAYALADVSAVKAVFGAPDTLVPSLKKGSTAPVTTEAVPNRIFDARISDIAPSADARSRVFDVALEISNPERLLKPGMVAVVSITSGPVAAQTPPVVPLSAIVRAKDKSDGYAVFVVEEAGGRSLVHLRDITVGEMLGNTIAVTSGLRLGERVVVSGSTIVTDGEAVQVIP